MWNTYETPNFTKAKEITWKQEVGQFLIRYTGVTINEVIDLLYKGGEQALELAKHAREEILKDPSIDPAIKRAIKDYSF